MAVELYDEHEQGERVRNWIKENGFAVVMGLVLAFGGIFGFRFWQDHQLSQRLLAADYFSLIQAELEAGQTDSALEQFERMRSEVGRSPFVGLSALALASAQIERGRLEPAAQLYRDILANGQMESLWPLTRLRLARVLEAQGDLPAALALLDRERVPAGFAAIWAETRGDLLLGLGRLDEARLAYQDALEAGGGQGMGQRLLQMKLDATGPGEARS